MADQSRRVGAEGVWPRDGDRDIVPAFETHVVVVYNLNLISKSWLC
jgi:hypothetical protein